MTDRMRQQRAQADGGGFCPHPRRRELAEQGRNSRPPQRSRGENPSKKSHARKPLAFARQSHARKPRRGRGGRAGLPCCRQNERQRSDRSSISQKQNKQDSEQKPRSNAKEGDGGTAKKEGGNGRQRRNTGGSGPIRETLFCESAAPAARVLRSNTSQKQLVSRKRACER